ncbi:MAG: hypothetical protein AAGK97_15120 [Bacteroidota bacterium]
MKSILNLMGMTLMCVLLFVACENENVNSSTDVENFVENSVEVVQRSAGAAKFGCFEFVYPIEVAFPDGTSLVADSLAALKAGIRDWKENNPDATEKPSLVYPIEVISNDGEAITVNARDELVDLKKSCRPRGKRGKACFNLVYPIDIAFPDGTVESFDDRRALKMALRTWKRENPDADERPTLVFPIEVTLEDGSVVEVASKDELVALKDTCMQ